MSRKAKDLTGEELGNRLLKSVKEMKAGKAAHVTQIAANDVAVGSIHAWVHNVVQGCGSRRSRNITSSVKARGSTKYRPFCVD